MTFNDCYHILTLLCLCILLFYWLCFYCVTSHCLYKNTLGQFSICMAFLDLSTCLVNLPKNWVILRNISIQNYWFLFDVSELFYQTLLFLPEFWCTYDINLALVHALLSQLIHTFQKKPSLSSHGKDDKEDSILYMETPRRSTVA